MLDTQYFGTTDSEKELNIEYNIHSLYGTMVANATYQFWKENNTLSGNISMLTFIGIRPFVVGKSLFAGAGKYASHWLGNNYSKWEYMRYSISGIMNFNMFGIPHVGADICGFYGNITDDLCGRWM